jgi:hypothetical protein
MTLEPYLLSKKEKGKKREKKGEKRKKKRSAPNVMTSCKSAQALDIESICRFFNLMHDLMPTSCTSCKPC